MNRRDEAFCEEYLIDLSPRHAAIRAGFAESTAENAYKWLDAASDRQKPAVRARIDKLMAERSRRTGVNADRVVRELACVAFVRASDVIDAKTGGLREDASPDDLAAVTGVRVKAGADFVEREVRLCDKTRALELLGKHLGMFTDRVQMEGAVPVIVDDSGDDKSGDDKCLIGFASPT